MIKSDFRKIAVSVILLIIGSVHNINGQGAYRLNLEEVVALAQSDAPDALLAST